MPIESILWRKVGEITRYETIEPGVFHTYRFDAEAFGKVMLTGCHEQDLGGKIYFLEEEELDELIKPDGKLSTKIENYNNEIIAPGATVPIPIITTAGPEAMFVFMHNSMN